MTEPTQCAWCGKPIKRSNKFCSMECYGRSSRKPVPFGLVTPEFLEEAQAALDANRAYLKEKYGIDRPRTVLKKPGEEREE